MASTDRTTTTSESHLIDVAEDIIGGYLEDSERRADLGQRHGIPALANAELRTSPRKGEMRVHFENGEEWTLRITASVTKRAEEPELDRRTVEQVAPDLTDPERVVLAAAINVAPGEQRPYADPSNGCFFGATFALEVLERAQYRNPQARDAGVSAAAKIRAGLAR